MDGLQKAALIGLLILLVASGDIFRAFQPSNPEKERNNMESTNAEISGNSQAQASKVSQLLQQRFPSAPLTLAPHPPPTANVILSRVLGFGQLAGLVVTFGGDSLFPAMGFAQPPTWYLSVQQNKMGTAAGIWILGNMGHNMLLSTGAFEVSYNGKMIFSKLKENRMPTAEEIIYRVSKAMEDSDALSD